MWQVAMKIYFYFVMGVCEFLFHAKTKLRLNVKFVFSCAFKIVSLHHECGAVIMIMMTAMSTRLNISDEVHILRNWPTLQTKDLLLR